MLFDHTCDALTTFIYTIGMSSVIGSKSPYLYFMLWTMASIPFYTTTIEALYTRVLRLAYINGASEGTIFACGFTTLTGFIGIYIHIKNRSGILEYGHKSDRNSYFKVPRVYGLPIFQCWFFHHNT